jgi:hypothetical protein
MVQERPVFSNLVTNTHSLPLLSHIPVDSRRKLIAKLRDCGIAEFPVWLLTLGGQESGCKLKNRRTEVSQLRIPQFRNLL